MQPATLKYAISDISPMPRAWLLLMQCVEELNNIDVTVRHRGLDGEGCEGTYGSITFRCLLKLVWDCVAHGDLPNPLLAPPPASATAGAGGASICVGGGLYEDQEVMARGGAAEASKPAHHGGRGAVEEGGVSLAAVPQRPGRLVDFGAGTGRALVLLQCLNLVEAAVGFEVDCTKADLVQLTPEALSAHSPSWGYAFWAGVPPEAQAAIWRLFIGCDTMTTLVLVGYGDRSAATLSQLMAQWDQGQGPLTGARRAVLRRVISNVASMGGNGCYSAFVLRKCAVAPRRAAVLVA
eukprot:XP_001692741.1 predicted protein [Chlamydomonas reinhardtii]